ncbi:hypothetical protein [Niallia sp. NCCP-28]|uniref:hypothetical protein n=1 Tax=Niallia sp. NCCP-28 TaxID=2934712 RepID=UPI0020880FD0|nr:hypothetical protein [Niallia sp. NCCP-28]GKU84044.1 hypothetical protein NCCP28_34400 [Niallia sp. NCCP-28]
MIIKKLLNLKSNKDLKRALLEIEEWTETGMLNQSGMLLTIHKEYEKKASSEQSLLDTKTEIVMEMGKRLMRKLLKRTSYVDLRRAYLEIEKRHDKGTLEESRTILRIHEEYRKLSGSEQSLCDTEKEILMEMGRRLNFLIWENEKPWTKY